MGEPEVEPKNEDTELESLLTRLKEVRISGPIGKSSGDRSMIELLKINGELTGKLIKSNKELIGTNKRMLTSLSVTERLTKALTALTFALLVLAILGIMVSTPWRQLPLWEFLVRVTVIVVLLGLLSFFSSSALREYFGKGRLGPKRLRRDG